jgi:hypothetical protein
MAWHSNGQRKMTGQYQDDVREGSFFWWHENGTRALSGQYDEGRKVGPWTWWHSNGMKSIDGTYVNDQPTGDWTWWNEEGQIIDQEDFGEAGTSSDVLVEPSQSNSPPERIEAWEPDDLPINSSPPSSGFEQMEEIRPMDSPNVLDDQTGQPSSLDLDLESIEPQGNEDDPLK